MQLAQGYLAHAQGDAPQAMATFAQSLLCYQELGHQEGISVCLAGLAGVLGSMGQSMRAARLFGAAAGLRARIGAGGQPLERAVYAASVASVRDTLGEEAFGAAWAAGQALQLKQAITEALGEA